jgi:glycosyltransferase involved in cell wall biosynthesis
MRITIFEHSDGGHRLTYVRQFLAALHGQPSLALTVATSTAAAASEAFAHQIAPWADRVPIETAPGVIERGTTFPDMLRIARKKVATLQHAILSTRPDCLILPTADGIAQLLALNPSALRSIERIELVLHGAAFAHPVRGLRRRLQNRLSLELIDRVPRARLHFVNAIGWDYLAARRPRLAARADVLPDPVDAEAPRDKAAARHRLGLPTDDILIVSGGLQNRRKGIDLLLRALSALPESTLARLRLVLAGRCDAEIAPMVASMPQQVASRIIRIDRYLSDAELADALSAADLVATCHPRHMGLSNIALRAASLERPVLASEWGWLGSIVPRFDLGWSGPISDPAAYATVIERAIESAATWKPSPRTRQLVAFHHPENFRANILGWFGVGDGGIAWPALSAQG